MTEKLLQYLWNFKIFKSFDFKDMEGHPIEILDYGKWNHNSGPDFLNAKIKTKGLILAGNIELHLKSSDWIFHRHTGDPAFGNLILHAVLVHDVEIPELAAQNVATTELSSHIDSAVLKKYELLMRSPRFIPCESIFHPSKVPVGFEESALLKKLDEKGEQIAAALIQTKNNFEAVLFRMLCYAFGLKVNAVAFWQMAELLDFSVVNKIRQSQFSLEALFYGIFGFLETPRDEYMLELQTEYRFLSAKYRIPQIRLTAQFMRLRPPGFPTIRLSQLADLYSAQQNLFSKAVTATDIQHLYEIFRSTKASSYWNNHFNFAKPSTVANEKVLTKDFVDIILMNAILPLKYYYLKNDDAEAAENILNLYRQVAAEKNTVMLGWKSLNVEISSALESQAYLYHFKNFCERKNCLNCSIGFKILKSS